MISNILCWVLGIYQLVVIAYIVISWLKPTANQWTELLRSVVEPVVAPVRSLLTAKLPTKWQIFDWAPVAVILLIEVLKRLIDIIL